ncbi:MAG: hypothetical protein R3C20_07725 [Planctomycetaceae bacterium]
MRRNLRQKSTLRTESALIEVLEDRALLTPIFPFVESGTIKLLQQQSTDSTQLLRWNRSTSETEAVATIPGLTEKLDVLGTINGKVLFRVESTGKLWATDGTTAGTQPIADVLLPSEGYWSTGAGTDIGLPKSIKQPLESAELNGYLYFSGDGGDGFELWRSDGTSAGTTQVSDINHGQDGPDGRIYFWDAVPGAVSYDVTVSAWSITEGWGGAAYDRSGPNDWITQNGVTDTYIEVGHVSNWDLYQTLLTVTPNFEDQTQGEPVEYPVRFLGVLNETSSKPSDFVVYEGSVYFSAETKDYGREIWKSDGTDAGTQLGVDVIPGPASSFPFDYVPFDGKLFFATFGNHDMYVTDGQTATRVLNGAGPSGSTYRIGYSPKQLAGTLPIGVINDRLVVGYRGDSDDGQYGGLMSYSSADDGSPHVIFSEIYSAATRPMEAGSYYDGITVLNGHLVFRSMGTPFAGYTFEGYLVFGSLISTDGLTGDELFETPVRQESAWTAPSDPYLPTLSIGSDQKIHIGANHNNLPWGAYAYAMETDGTLAGSRIVSSDSSGSTDPRFYGWSDGSWFYVDMGDTPASRGYLPIYKVIEDGEDILVGGAEFDGLASEIYPFDGGLFVTSGKGTLYEVPNANYSTAPILVSGGIGKQLTSTPTLSWPEAPGPVARYDLAINPVGARSTITYRRTNLTSTSHTAETAIPDGDYEVWVRAYYTDGTYTAWGPTPPQMTILTQVPDGKPTVTGPARAILPTSNQPTLSWTAVPGAQTYQVWLSNNYSTAAVVHRDGLTSTELRVPKDLAPGMYRLWVRAKNEIGTSGYTAPYYFQIMHDAVVPTEGIGNTTDSTPVIAWQKPAGNAVRYDVAINKVGDRTTLYRKNALATTSHEIPESLPDGSYEVWVRAYFDDGSFSQWLPSELRIGTSRPATAPILTGPAVNQPDRSLPVRLSWNPVAGAFSYQVYVSLQNSIAALVDQKGVQDTFFDYQPVISSNPIAYRYWVRAENSFGFGPWTPARSFAVGQLAAIISGGGQGNDATPTLTFRQSSLKPARYDLFIASETSLYRAVYRRADLTSETHTLEEALPIGKYRAWVRIIYADSSATAWSQAVAFEIV